VRYAKVYILLNSSVIGKFDHLPEAFEKRYHRTIESAVLQQPAQSPIA
jgi:hypothetical protein